MKATKKIVSALLCAAILLMGAVTPAGSVNAEAKAKTRNVTIGGIVFKIPVSYKSNKDLKLKGYKIYINTDELLRIEKNQVLVKDFELVAIASILDIDLNNLKKLFE